jgi:hypothetical protein
MKKYFAIFLFVFCFTGARAQTIQFGDLVDLVNLTLPQVDNVLIQTGKFKINDKEEQYGQVITRYQSIDKDKRPIKGETMITGAYRTAGDGIKLRTITYQTIYPEYIENLSKQILKFGYRLTFKGADTQRRLFIYDNPINHITVAMNNDHTMNSIEIKQKEIGLEP